MQVSGQNILSGHADDVLIVMAHAVFRAIALLGAPLVDRRALQLPRGKTTGRNRGTGAGVQRAIAREKRQAEFRRALYANTPA